MDESQGQRVNNFHTLVLPVAPQPDTLAAIFILKKFGKTSYPGIESINIINWQILPEGKTTDELTQEGYILMDIGGGTFDHHSKEPKTTASLLVAETLGVSDDGALQKLLEYARRDDFFGKGTVSEDALDRAFGLSALVAHLNRSLVGKPQEVAEIVLPLLAAHYNEENRRVRELPEELTQCRENGRISEQTVRQRDKNLKVIFIQSDNTGMPGFLRSQNGGKYDVVVQRTKTGHVNILTRSVKRIDLRSLALVIRMQEAEAEGIELRDAPRTLLQPGRHAKIGAWYYDPATNSIQNGGVNPRDILPTKIPWDEFPRVVETGLSEQLFDPRSRS